MNSKYKSLAELTSELCLIPGLSGYEDEVRKFIQKKLSSNNLNFTSDTFGNLICSIEGKPDLPSVMLFAHMDQLGFVIRKIENDGLIRIERVGGVPEKSLLSQSVVVKSSSGKYFTGVIGNKSHHATLSDEKYKISTYRELAVDFGFESIEEVKKNEINIGSPITYKPSIEIIGSNKLVGTSLDDRAGCAIIFEVAKELLSIKDKPTVHIIFSVQEEFNLRGVLPVAQKIQPDIAIQVDISLSGDTPEMQDVNDIKLGEGPCISLYSFHGRGTLNGVIPHPKLVKHIENIAKKEDIKIQRIASSGILTDGSYVQTVGKGVATIDLGFPIRYSHSSNEVCDLKDLFNLKSLIVSSIKGIDENFNLSRD